MAHLKNKHGANLSTYKCHVCRVTFMKIDQLLAVTLFIKLIAFLIIA